MKAVARGLVWWPGLDKDLESKVKDCVECGITQKRPPAAQVHSWVYLSGPWKRVHIDFAQYGHDHYLVVIDAFSKWPEIIHMGATTTASATVVMLREIFSRNGIPRVVVSDNGPQFISEEFVKFMAENGICHKKIPPYHPATNGLAERMVQELKLALKRNAVARHPVQKQHLLANFCSHTEPFHIQVRVSPQENFCSNASFELVETSSSPHLWRPCGTSSIGTGRSRGNQLETWNQETWYGCIIAETNFVHAGKQGRCYNAWAPCPT